MNKLVDVVNGFLIALHSVALVLMQVVAMILPFVGLYHLAFVGNVFQGFFEVVVAYVFMEFVKEMNN